MSVAREPVRFNEQDDNRTTIAKLNRLVDELYTKLATAELRVTQVLKFTKSPTNLYVLTCDADGNATWQEAQGGEPGGSDTQVQFNDGGEFGGDSGLIYNASTNVLTLSGDLMMAGDLECIDIAATSLTTTGNVEIGSSGKLYLKNQTVPATSSSDGIVGTLVPDGNHIYYKVSKAPHLWKRVAWDAW